MEIDGSNVGSEDGSVVVGENDAPGKIEGFLLGAELVEEVEFTGKILTNKNNTMLNICLSNYS